MPDPIPHIPVVVVGAGQAGLSISFHLKARGIEHLVFEKHRALHVWRDAAGTVSASSRPIGSAHLPGHPYRGGDPHGFMVKDEILEYLSGFASAVDAPLREASRSYAFRRARKAASTCRHPSATYRADAVVAASGGYHEPIVPRLAERLPKSIVQLHSEQYRNPQSLPEGAVLVVGGGQSARRSPRTCIWPAGASSWRSAAPRAARASIAAGTSSPGLPTWAITTCPSSASLARRRARQHQPLCDGPRRRPRH